MSEVRVRFAPSPTGFFHIGSARTALFNWLYARKTGGTFILRIEDTDKARNTDEALRVLLSGLRWLGMDWDEGPEAGGDRGPYFQSQRDAIYREYFEKLKATGRTYEKDGAVYFRISGEPQIIEDAVRGRVERTEEKDFVILRSDGSPVFHLVNVIDDIAMGVTHVIRGEDHLSNTSKHTELFKAFGAPLPTFAHIPLILKQNGPGKMSKRDTGALIEEYEQRGFLPEALRNYLCLLGWNPKDDREIMPIEDIIAAYDLSGINKNNARFDEKKLSFMNTEYTRNLPFEDFCEKARIFLADKSVIDGSEDPDYFRTVMGICQEKTRGLETLPDLTGYFFSDEVEIIPAAREKVFKKGEPAERVREFLSVLEETDDFSVENLERVLNGMVAERGCKLMDYMGVVRLAVSGTDRGPGFYELLHVLGRDRSLDRIRKFVSTLS